ncbi:MAG: adenine nucleotide alpha hydrolase [Planctomycetota bacterium]|nr:adenine nucleotide alpha hydrolase [Planctomycetota bacterium]
MKKRTWLSWSSGKDSAWALLELQRDPSIELCGLLTTVNETHGRVAMHAVRQALLETQAERAGLPLIQVNIPSPCTNEQYQEAMAAAMERAKGDRIQAVAFGDLFLEDIREYREKNLEPTGIEPLFPLWQRNTRDLAQTMVEGGLKANLTCVDPRQCPTEFVGRAFDAALLRELPESVDPCGENGEFHTFVHAGPMFRAPINIQVGELVERDGFQFADILPATA